MYLLCLQHILTQPGDISGAQWPRGIRGCHTWLVAAIVDGAGLASEARCEEKYGEKL